MRRDEAAAVSHHQGEGKSEQADEMFAQLIRHMDAATTITRADNHTDDMETPAWLS